MRSAMELRSGGDRLFKKPNGGGRAGAASVGPVAVERNRIPRVDVNCKCHKVPFLRVIDDIHGSFLRHMQVNSSVVLKAGISLAGRYALLSIH
jgi:hypothetical protein